MLKPRGSSYPRGVESLNMKGNPKDILPEPRAHLGAENLSAERDDALQTLLLPSRQPRQFESSDSGSRVHHVKQQYR